MDRLRELLLKKEKEIVTDLDREKINNLKFLLQKDNIFFELDIDTAVGILSFLGIEKDEIKNVYLELVSPENYLKVNKPYITLSEGR